MNYLMRVSNRRSRWIKIEQNCLFILFLVLTAAVAFLFVDDIVSKFGMFGMFLIVIGVLCCITLIAVLLSPIGFYFDKQYRFAILDWMNSMSEAVSLKNQYLNLRQSYDNQYQAFKSRWGWIDGLTYYDGQMNSCLCKDDTIIQGLLLQYSQNGSYVDWRSDVLKLKQLYDDMQRIHVDALNWLTIQARCQHFDCSNDECQKIISLFLLEYDVIPINLNEFVVLFANDTGRYCKKIAIENCLNFVKW